MVRGTDRRSHITKELNGYGGTLFVVLYTCIMHYFYELEDCNLLDVEDDYDLFALHYTFIPRINNQLSQFVSIWNMQLTGC